MYESPIELFIDPIEPLIEQMAAERNRQIENYVIEVLRVNGITVDKERLERALINDKNQYYRGYADGVREFADRLKKEKYYGSNWLGYGTWAVEIEDIDDLVKEMVGESEWKK